MSFVAPDKLQSCGKQLSLDSEHFGSLRDSNELLSSPELLRTRMKEDGYLYLPGFLNREDVKQTRLSILSKLNQEGIFDPGYPLNDAVVQEGVDMAFRPDLANGNRTLEEMIYSKQMMDFYTTLLGGESMHYDYTWLRAVAPGRFTMPHYDIVYMGRGTKDVFTAWVPLSDVTYELGGLMILENSHRWAELRNTYGEMDVDVVCENKDRARYMDEKGYRGFGALPESPEEIRKTFGTRWLTAPFRMGDLLTFGMYTLHCSSDNMSDRLRLSIDARFQLASEPADERWIGKNPIGHGPEAHRGVIC